MTVELRYYVTFGEGDGTDWLDWKVELTPEEECAYKNAVENKIPLDEVEELNEALSRAYDEIQSEEINNSIDMDDEYALECMGDEYMDTDELNELVHDKDSYALEFFGLTDVSDEEIANWNADDLAEIPTIAEFDEDFESRSPFDEGWSLCVEFVDPNEEC